METPLQKELLFAKDIALKAGSMLVEHMKSPSGIERKQDGTPVSDVDKKVANLIANALIKDFPQYAVLDEENLQGSASSNKKGIWIVDPLDGTKEYLAGGKDFGVLIGLIQNGMPVLGVAYRPMIDELTYAVRGQGAFIQYGSSVKHLTIPPFSSLSAIVSTSREDEELTRILKSLQPETIHKMHSAFKVIEVAKGTATAYICSRVNTMHVWDICAPSVILEESGGKVTDLYGNPIDYSLSQTKCLLGIVASDVSSHEAIINKISSIVK